MDFDSAYVQETDLLAELLGDGKKKLLEFLVQNMDLFIGAIITR